MLNDAGRSAYLSAMGVPEYVLRTQLLNAAQSSHIAGLAIADSGLSAANPEVATEPPPSSSSNTAVTAPVSPDTSTSASASISGALAEFSLDAASRTPAKPLKAKPDEKAGVATERPSPVSFALRLIYSNCGWLLVDGPGEASAVAAASQETESLALAHNILSALSRQGDTLQLKPKRFQWPMSRNAQMDHSEVAAREALKGVLTAVNERQGPQRILLLGDDAQRWVSSLVDSESQVLVCGPALVEMLSNYQAKAALWQQLKPFSTAVAVQKS